MLFYTLEGLKQDTPFQVQAECRNELGWSIANEQFVFRTSKGEWKIPSSYSFSSSVLFRSAWKIPFTLPVHLYLTRFRDWSPGCVMITLFVF